MEIEIRYRVTHGVPPQPIKLKIPGWAGDSREYGDGAVPQPWHCPPFVDASTFGLELLYPFDECLVRNVGGKAVFEGLGEPVTGVTWPPFEMFAPGHYGFTSSLDIVGPPGYVIRLESHPCYYTDDNWETPCVVPGHLQTEWWSRIFFVVFKLPPPGFTHVFKKNYPYAQILVVPKKVSYDIWPMDAAESAERVGLERLIAARHDGNWQDASGRKFSDRYKVLAGIFAKEGVEGVKKFLAQQPPAV